MSCDAIKDSFAQEINTNQLTVSVKGTKKQLPLKIIGNNGVILEELYLSSN